MNYIGEIYETNGFGKLVVLEKIRARYFKVKFIDTGFETSARLDAIKYGMVRDKSRPTVYNRGFIGEGKYKAKENSKSTVHYNIWYDMMTRCYNENYHDKQPTYIDCEVCSHWFNFQNFAEWFDLHYVENYQLDKDILFKGNKFYSPEYCRFVPKSINCILTNSYANRGRYALGVTKRGNRYRAACNNGFNKHIFIGSFETEDEAFNAYKAYKENIIKEQAELYKSNIPIEIYQALLNYKVDRLD